MAQRGDPLSSTGSYTGRGASRGTTRGSNNYSVYDRPSSTSGIDAYNDRSRDAYYDSYNYKGSSPDYRNAPDNITTGGISDGQGGWSDRMPTSLAEVGKNVIDYGKGTAIYKIGKNIYDNTLMSATGEWLGDLADSPWNPVNWESGAPPEWSVELGDGTVLGRGTLERQGGMMTGGGGQANNRWYNPQTQQYEDLSSKKQGNPEQYRALYGVDSENPEGIDVPAGSFYNYETKALEEFSGGGYSNSRKVLRSNAWKNAGIDDLKLSDEEYSKLTEEEKQANFEARQAAAASDPMNFGGVDSTSPFGNDKITYNMGIYTPQNEEEENAVLREMFNKGEITQVELDRYLDDAKRSQGRTSEQGKELASQVEFLKEEGGYTDEELAGFVEDFTQQAFSTQGVRSKDDYFDVFQDSLNALDDVDDNLKLETYNLYDTKREEDYNNAFDYLDSLRGTNDFNQAYASTDVDKRNAYLRHGYEQGSITEEAYLNGVAQNLVEDGEFAFKLEDGRIAIGTEEGIYGDHRILEVSDTEDKEYTQTERNYARANKLKLGEGTAYEGPTSLEGFTDEQNARRKEIARLDAGGYKLSDTIEAKERPKPSRFKKFTGALKTVGLNAITGGLYSAVPAGINILKGEGSTDDWLAFGPVALEATGLVTPPATSEEAAAIQDRVTDEAISRGYSASEAASMGYDASQSALAGVGLDLGVAQLTYEQTNQVIQAAAAENLPQYVAKEFGIPLLKNKLSDSWEEFKKNNMLPVGNPAFVGEWQDAWDSIPEDIQAGLNETFEKLAEGEPLDEALAEGVVEYIKESPVGGWIEDSIKQAGSDFDDAYLQPIKEFAEEVVNVDAAKAFLSNFDDEVIQPVVEPVQEAGRAIDDTLIQPPKEFVEGLFDGTDEDKDDSSSNIRRRDPLTSEKKSGGGESMILGGLFDRELFKFKEKDKLELEVPKEVERKRYVEGDLFDDPFASTFDDRNLV